MEFQGFPKIARLRRTICVTEKLDGTNAQIVIVPRAEATGLGGFYDEATDQFMYVGSRTRWITPGKDTDNYGFARWAQEHAAELFTLGPGQHFGEWWGQGIQRGYGLNEKRFSLFNTHRWGNPESRPACVGVVPVLYHGVFSEEKIKECLIALEVEGSKAAPGFGSPEGIVIYHEASKQLYKQTIAKDEEPKGAQRGIEG